MNISNKHEPTFTYTERYPLNYSDTYNEFVKWWGGLLQEKPMLTRSFIVSLEPLAMYLSQLLVGHQGYRGITLDPRMFNELTYGTAANVISIIIGVMDPKLQHRFDNNSTSMMIQGCADALAFAVNSYGIGKHLSDDVAVDMINKLETEAIKMLSNLLPDIDNDDVSVQCYERLHPQTYLITLNYPEHYAHSH